MTHIASARRRGGDGVESRLTTASKLRTLIMVHIAVLDKGGANQRIGCLLGVTSIIQLIREGGDFNRLVHKVLNNIFLFVSFTSLGTFTEFWLVSSIIWVSYKFIYKIGYIVYHHWVCISIYWPFSYILKSLSINTLRPLEEAKKAQK